jgi:hypothetical protein
MMFVDDDDDDDVMTMTKMTMIMMLTTMLQALLGVHKSFKLELIQSVTSGSPKLSDVFVRYKTKLLIYGDFCANLPQAQAHIDKLCQEDTIKLKILVRTFTLFPHHPPPPTPLL